MFPLEETLFHGEPARALTVDDPHACLDVIVEMMDDRYYLLAYAETGEYVS